MFSHEDFISSGNARTVLCSFVLGRFARLAPDVPAQRAAVLDWTLEHMLRPPGYFVFESTGSLLHRFGRSLAFPRWQAWMLLALLESA